MIDAMPPIEGVQLDDYSSWFYYADTKSMRLTLVCKKCASYVDGNSEMQGRHIGACWS